MAVFFPQGERGLSLGLQNGLEMILVFLLFAGALATWSDVLDLGGEVFSNADKLWLLDSLNDAKELGKEMECKWGCI
jgi:hypothetical protein